MTKKILIFIIMLLLASSARADVVSPTENDFSYLFHLYYDTGKLVADRDFQFNYDILGAPYVQPSVTAQFPYRGEIINMTGEVATHFVFDPKQGDTKFTKGKVAVKAAYVPDGQRAVFYDNQNQPILTIPVSASSFCNDDGICNADRGEDSLTCPKDCKQTLPAPPVTTPAAAPDSPSDSILTGILYTLLGVVLIGFLWWFLRRRKNQSFSPRPPSTPLTPPTSLPTPPAPPSSNNPV